MTTTNGTINARTARKSLADQIDRLDGILDGLAEALNESVADAVKDVIAKAVRSAVETAVKEVLSSPDLLRAALEKHAPPPASPVQPPAPEAKPPTLKEHLARIGNRLSEKVMQAASLVKKTMTEVCGVACAAAKKAGEIAANAPTIFGRSPRPCGHSAGPVPSPWASAWPAA